MPATGSLKTCAAACSRICETAAASRRRSCAAPASSAVTSARCRRARGRGPLRQAANCRSDDHGRVGWRDRRADRRRPRARGCCPEGRRGPRRAPSRRRGRSPARLGSHGPAGFSSFCADPAELGRAICRGGAGPRGRSPATTGSGSSSGGIGGGVYRLLFRALASNPEEVQSFYEDTVAALVDHDREYRTDLLGTLEAYLANDCNTNATARAVFAHRHTVAHRLERVRELTGLDPSKGEDRERLGLGIKAYRLLAPTLPR